MRSDIGRDEKGQLSYLYHNLGPACAMYDLMIEMFDNTDQNYCLVQSEI